VSATCAVLKRFEGKRAILDKSTRNKILSKIPYGLFIVGSKRRESVSAIIANWITQVSFEPPLIAFAVEFDSNTHHFIDESKYFSLNMLPVGSKVFAKAFLKKTRHIGSTINEKEFTISKHGLPFLRDASDSLECKVVDSTRVGDHVLFVGEVIDGVSNGNGGILTLKETGWQYSR
jgi:flavin reductase (DIM6/NTAB) family NADH-FMN oxidoreductase RutF